MNLIREIRSTFNNLDSRVKWLVIVSLVLGSLARFLGFFNVGYFFDIVQTQYLWGLNAFNNGYFTFWQSFPNDYFYDYPPLSLLIEWVLVFLIQPFGDTPANFAIALKSLNWLVEILFGLWMVKLGLEHNIISKEKVFLVASLYYLLPSVWIVSAVWGQSDTLIVYLTLISLFLLWRAKNEDKNIRKSFVLTVYSGLLFALAFWIKQQPILLLPIFGLVFVTGLKIKEILWMIVSWIPFFGLIVVGYILSNPMFFGGSSDHTVEVFVAEYLDVSLSGITNWQVAAFCLLVALWLQTNLALLQVIYLYFKSKRTSSKPSRLLYFWLWVSSSLGLSAAISTPLIILNYNRYLEILLATAIRTPTISNGAATFWSLLGVFGDSGQTLFGSFVTISSTGIIIFTIAFFVILFRFKILNWVKFVEILKVNKWKTKLLELWNFKPFVNLTLSSIIWLSLLTAYVYFEFFTKVHSRYLHFALLINFLVPLLIKLKPVHFRFWVWNTLLINIGYFFNQALVYASDTPDPAWLRVLVTNFNVDFINLSGLLIFLGFLGVLRLMWFWEEGEMEN